MDRLIELMNAASRRLEARAALIRAETANRSVIYRAFCNGATAGMRAYVNGQRFDQEAVWNDINDAANGFLATHKEAGEDE